MESPRLGPDFSECIKLGILRSPSGRFLTAEVFNNEINVSGTALRRRQVWTVMVERGRPQTVYLQSHLGRFLSADKDGRVSGAAVTPGEDERFMLEFSPQSTGEWAFRSETHGFYLSASDTSISCFSKTPVWWSVRLAIHPQVHLRHQFRSRYFRMMPDGSELRADMPYPWGPETLLWIEQLPMPGTTGPGGPAPATGPTVGRSAVARLGRVALRCHNGQYLQPDGSFTDTLDDSVLFAFELRPGNPHTFAFRDSTGAYLTTTGPGTAKIKLNSTVPGKEELFLIERASLQVGVLAHNGKYASVKQGTEISANQHELDETAIFQLEYLGGKGFSSSDTIAAAVSVHQNTSFDGETPTSGVSATNGMTPGVYCLVTGHWCLRSRNGKLWRMAPSSGVQNTASDGDKDSLFEILTLSDDNNSGQGQVVLRSNTADGGQSLSARKLGAISSSGRAVSEVEQPASTDLFRLLLVNRPSIVFLSVLTGGFISRGKQTSLDCSNTTYEPFFLRQTKQNTYQFFARGPQSTYSIWTACSDGFVHLKSTKQTPDDESESATVEPGSEFLLYFLGNGRAMIRVASEAFPGLCLLKAEAKGEVKYDSAGEIFANYIWEI
ncbi:Fascin [Fasciolopsis buskii]|uniref:Fascin n=1 Tax=Fasciolopsis buskii TaxID=27845 RepID=A0A8E0VL76_9TREM|nr:Fascin [Fasciolopsis buski]